MDSRHTEENPSETDEIEGEQYAQDAREGQASLGLQFALDGIAKECFLDDLQYAVYAAPDEKSPVATMP